MECIHTYIHTYGMWVASTIVLAFITLLLLGGGRHIYRKKKEDNSVRTQKNDAKVSGDGNVVIQSGDNPSITIAMPENGSPVRQSDDPTPIAIETQRKITKKNGDQVEETIVKFFDTPAGKEMANKHFSEKYQGTTLTTCQKCCVKFCLLAPTLEIAEKIREDGKSGRLESVIVELLKRSPIPDLDCEKLRIKVTNVNVTTRSAKEANMTSDVRVDQEQQLVYQSKNPDPIPAFPLLRLKDLPKTWATLAMMPMGFGAILYNFIAFVSNTSTGHKVNNGDREECSSAEEIMVEVTFEVENNEMKHQEPEQLSLTKYKRSAGRTKHKIYTPKDFVINRKVEDDAKTHVSGGHVTVMKCTPAEDEGRTAYPWLKDESFLPMYKSPGYSAASGLKGSSIVEAMEILGEQGQWGKFDAVMKHVTEEMADPDVLILVTFEAIVASYYRCEFAKAAELLQKAFDLIPQTKCPIEHQAHALYTMSAIKRREGKHQESDNAIHHAMQVIRHVESGRNAGEVFYNCACLLAQVNSGSTKRDNKTFIDARQNFLLAIDHFQRGIQGRVYTVSCGNKLRKAFIRLAMLLLDCSVDVRNVGRPISADDLIMAQNCLRKVESDLWEGITLRARCYWLMATAVLFYRLEQFSRATDYARTAYDIATSLDFQPEVQFAHNLMTDATQELMTL